MTQIRAVIFDRLLVAAKVRDLVDTDLGYPKQGVNAATGAVVPGPIGRTLNATYAFRHPSLAKWAAVITPEVRAALVRIRAAAQARISAGQSQPEDAEIVAAPAEADLDDTWKG